MDPCRLHITGASGTGTTTLARRIAQKWSVPCHDTDDYYWVPTSPPFARKRAEEQRLSLMNSLFVPRDAWVLSGSLMGWGDALTSHFDAVVFLSLDPSIRMSRLKKREIQRYGETALAEGGSMHANFSAFLDWAENYDNPDFAGRSRSRHERWLSDLPCPVLRLNSDRAVERLVSAILSA